VAQPGRWVMAHHEAEKPVTVTRIDGRDARRATQQHSFAELILILPTGQLVCEVVLGDESYVVEGPASVYVPAGLAHAVNAKAGAGFYVEMAAEGWSNGTTGSHPARRTATSEGGVSTRMRSSVGRGACSV
jgi:hypothetical protein